MGSQLYREGIDIIKGLMPCEGRFGGVNTVTRHKNFLPDSKIDAYAFYNGNMINRNLKNLLLTGNSQFWFDLSVHTHEARTFDVLFALSTLRKKAHSRQLPVPQVGGERVRIALVGGYSLYPFCELLEHLCEMEGLSCDLWKGDFDNYISEIMDDEGGLYAFKPQIVLVLPSEHRSKYTGKLTDSRDTQQKEVDGVVGSLLGLAHKVHAKTCAEVFIVNFMLPARQDLGPYRSRTLGSDWSFRKMVNLELGLNAPSYIHICDMEFLSARHGGLNSRDDRGWFESKQPCSPQLLVEMSREVTRMIIALRRPMKKVLVLDLDNTLWGGVIADDGLEGIEIGDTSPRGEAFKAFQKYILSLKERGTLLAVCSKNDYDKAAEAFEKHPEMVLKLEDFVSFKANWEPKSDNIRQMAVELNLGVDSFVFVDDNPAEVEIVRQFLPEVATILLKPDPSEYVGQLQDGRFFEPRNITVEDLVRSNQYRSEQARKELQASVTDMDSYLTSLEMEAMIQPFAPVDVPRIAQLINKSNQFNLTTRRRTEADIHSLINASGWFGLSIRLKDRFGDHGLISVVIGEKLRETFRIDTWLMSCRVLKRQVEDLVLNVVAEVAISQGCKRLEGEYIPTPKNGMVHDFYSKMGFFPLNQEEEDVSVKTYQLDLGDFQPHLVRIKRSNN